ncbi:hypothetical protein BS17DRAFT_61505 [Gyrodon lividus]|nr:hypothetical protein BS17DRAFT_61505 [Gyrodon lividus]
MKYRCGAVPYGSPLQYILARYKQEQLLQLLLPVTLSLLVSRPKVMTMIRSSHSSMSESLQLDDYKPVVIATAVGYDYILAFPTEIEFVWKRRWSWVSFLFLVVRYLGLFDAM